LSWYKRCATKKIVMERISKNAESQKAVTWEFYPAGKVARILRDPSTKSEVKEYG